MHGKCSVMRLSYNRPSIKENCHYCFCYFGTSLVESSAGGQLSRSIFGRVSGARLCPLTSGGTAPKAVREETEAVLSWLSRRNSRPQSRIRSAAPSRLWCACAGSLVGSRVVPSGHAELKPPQGPSCQEAWAVCVGQPHQFFKPFY